MLAYLENAALPDAKGVSEQVKVGASDLHILDTAHVGPGHHLSPNKQTDGWMQRQTGADTPPSSSLDSYLIGLEAGSPPM